MLPHDLHFKMSDELQCKTEEEKFESFLTVKYESSSEYGKDITTTPISIQAYKVHTKDPMPLCNDKKETI